MSPRAPIIVVHRRNRIDQLEGLPAGCWIECDVENSGGRVCLTHDAVSGGTREPDDLESFLERALAKGVRGFVFDCKREAVERIVSPILVGLGIRDYFYLNEMEVQADIFMEQDPAHQSGIRLWQYRRASDIIRYASDRAATGKPYPRWVWLDCWESGLLSDIQKACLPATAEEVSVLRSLGVRICLCSPELYTHKYGAPYTDAEMDAIHDGVRSFARRLCAEEIAYDAVCTKFPRLWTESDGNFMP